MPIPARIAFARELLTQIDGQTQESAAKMIADAIEMAASTTIPDAERLERATEIISMVPVQCGKMLDTDLGCMIKNFMDGSVAPIDGHVLIARERLRGIAQEGFDSKHDDEHDRGELITAAVAYCTLAHQQGLGLNVDSDHIRVMYWPWEKAWWKPVTPIRDLVRAGAMIAAEVDRLLRKKA